MTASSKRSFAAHMLLYGIILFLVEFVRGAFLVSFLPTYAVHALGFTVTTVGWAVSVHYVTDTFIKCYAGYLLDRFPLRLIVPAGLVVSLGGLWLLYSVKSLWLLIGASALFGIGMSPIWLVCLSKVRPEHRAEHMGLLYTCWLAGLGAGPVVLNFIMDISYSISYWCMMILWGISLLLSFFISNKKASTPAQIPLRDQISMLWERLRTMKSLLPGMTLQTTAAGMLVPVLPGFASKVLGFNYSQYSYLLIAGGAFTVMALIPMGKLSDRFGKKWFLIAGFTAFAVILFLLTFAKYLWLSLLLAALLGISYAAVLPAWNALLAQYVPKNNQGMGWGLFSSVEGIGVIIGPVLGGWIADTFSESFTIMTSAVLLGFIAVYYFVAPPEGAGKMAALKK
ncbi:MFS transporter [Paenibacillus sp. OAS669]|uniref:MFS transporter n=1 Tax=Paenibacillus sp. OAS669 TaxID=2663821 RepID=UPI001789758E|nr:MFS transporter [Paenibacillus sp. OAS669]MBE1443685.1 MFS family permease [Paenibacillus sp. OAS669]